MTELKIDMVELVRCEVASHGPRFAPSGVAAMPYSVAFPAGTEFTIGGGPRNNCGFVDDQITLDVSGMIPGSTHVFFVPAEWGGNSLVKVIVTDGKIVRSGTMEQRYSLHGTPKVHLPDACFVWSMPGK